MGLTGQFSPGADQLLAASVLESLREQPLQSVKALAKLTVGFPQRRFRVEPVLVSHADQREEYVPKLGLAGVGTKFFQFFL